jgi:hypothetical protein
LLFDRSSKILNLRSCDDQNMQFDLTKGGQKHSMTHVAFRSIRAFAIGGLATGAALWLAVPGFAQGTGLAMLSTLTKGEWTIKQRGGVPDRKICVRTGAELIQLRHREAGCNQFVVEDGAARVTVQYTCPGNGYGRTSIRRETPALVQLESQGIHDGTPFQFIAEARRTGTC